MKTRLKAVGRGEAPRLPTLGRLEIADHSEGHEGICALASTSRCRCSYADRCSLFSYPDRLSLESRYLAFMDNSLRMWTFTTTRLKEAGMLKTQ